MSRYMVISSDCHAGLPGEEYRQWLDPEHRDAFGEYLKARAVVEADLAERGLRNEEFAEEWESENAEGLRGGWNAARRDRELDADGVVGEVVFPDADGTPSAFSIRWTVEIPTDALSARSCADQRKSARAARIWSDMSM